MKASTPILVAAVVMFACVAATWRAQPGVSAQALRGPDGEKICTQSLLGPRWVKRPQLRSVDHRNAGNRYVVTAQRVTRGCGWAIGVARKLMRVRTGTYRQHYPDMGGNTWLPPPAKGWYCSGEGPRLFLQGAGMAKTADGVCYTPSGPSVRWFPYICLPSVDYSEGTEGLCGWLTGQRR